MADRAIPENSASRRLIVVVKSNSLNIFKNSPATSEIYADDSVFVLDPSITKQSPLLERLTSSNLLIHDRVLVQSPYNDQQYAELEDAPLTFARAKSSLFITFCKYLGAKKIQLEDSAEKKFTKITDQTIDLDAKRKDDPIVNVSTVKNLSMTESLKTKVNVDAEFDGSKPDIELAEAHLRKHNLLYDEELTELLNQRKGDNPLKSLTVTLSLMKESKMVFSLATTVSAKIFGTAKGKTSWSTEEISSFSKKVIITF